MRALLLLLLSVSSFPLLAIDLPEATNGYEWVVYNEAKIAYLKPDGWFEKRENKGDTYALFLSKEDIEKDGEFQTGLSVNVIGEITKKTQLQPTQYAISFIKEIMNSKEVIVPPFMDKLAEQVNGMGIRFRGAGRSPPIIVHYYLIADDGEDTLRIMIFEAPEDEWESAEKVGTIMLNGKMWK